MPRRINPLTGESSEEDPGAEPVFPGLFHDIAVISEPGAETPYAGTADDEPRADRMSNLEIIMAARAAAQEPMFEAQE